MKEVSKRVRERCADDLALIAETLPSAASKPSSSNNKESKESSNSVPQIPLDDRPFVRMTYDEALQGTAPLPRLPCLPACIPAKPDLT